MRSINFENNDLCIKDKRLQMVDGNEQKMQKTKQCLQVSKGELFYNSDVGLVYSDVLDVKNKMPMNRRKIAVQEALIQDDNIEKVTNVAIDIDKKSRTAAIDLQLKYKNENTSTTLEGVQIG